MLLDTGAHKKLLDMHGLHGCKHHVSNSRTVVSAVVLVHCLFHSVGLICLVRVLENAVGIVDTVDTAGIAVTGIVVLDKKLDVEVVDLEEVEMMVESVGGIVDVVVD